MAGTAGKIGQKILQGALVAYTGYEVGKNSDYPQVQPNITITIPSLGEHRTGANELVIILFGIILALITLIVLKFAISSFIKRTSNRSNGHSLQRVCCQNHRDQPIPRANPGPGQAQEVHVCPA